MKTKLFILSLLAAATCGAQNIATKALSPGVPLRIQLSPALTTTLLFPGPLAGVFGLGLITGTNSQTTGGTVQVEHPDGSNVLVLHALSETARVLATVLLDGQLYVLAIESSPTPDVAITLVKAGSPQDPSSAPRAVAVTPEEIVANRPKYDAELLVGFLRRARDANILRPIQPALYDGYKSRETAYTSENTGVYKTTVTTIHRFSKDDVTVLQGTVENESDRPLTFDGRAVTVLVANEVHPAKIVDVARPIPPHARTLMDVAIEGDVDGSRANLSIDNEFRIILPSEGTIWNLKNGGSAPKGPVKMRPPINLPAIPLTQLGAPKKEGQ